MPEPLISIAEARRRVLEATRPLPTESIRVTDALGRVLAEDVAAARDTPPFPCSAMDGYAIKHGPAGRTLEVIGESRAGSPASQPLRDDTQAIRISTGAAVPDQADAVIRQEDVESATTTITTRAATTAGENLRFPGEDMRAGTAVLSAGMRLLGAELGAAIAAGAATLAVYRAPAVTVLATGDELREPGAPLGPGEIHNSNGPMLAALAERAGARPHDPRRLPDDRAQTQAALARALATSDAVIISGGVSVGPHDHVKPALEALGVRPRFWGVKLQPGKPTWFGTQDDTLVFGLPGNPVSAYVTFTLFALPALAGLQGAAQPDAALLPQATLASDFPRNPSREQAIRVRLERRNGRLTAVPNGGQASHVVTSLIGADALVFIPPGEGSIPRGTQVELYPLPK